MTRLSVLRTAAVAMLAASCGGAAGAQLPAPTCTGELYAQQDFTVGHWDVYNGEKKSAEVVMEKTLDGCAILEHWKTPPGNKGNGIGLFVYSDLLKAWSYLWASDLASTTAFKGSLIKPGEIRYVTEKPLGEGKVRLRHWSLILMPGGKVRELSVGTEDQGKTWTTEYDLTWVKKAG